MPPPVGRQAHNPEGHRFNPVPATSHQALETHEFQGFFASQILAGDFTRGSVVEAAGGKPQREIDVARRDVMTQL